MANGAAALLVIDIQNDYFAGGLMELDQPDRAADNASRLLNSFREQGKPVIYIQHEEPTGSPTGFFYEGTAGQRIHDKVAPLDNETVIVKSEVNSFLGTSLAATLQKRNIKQLVVCGMMTHMCVESAVRAASDRGFEVTVIEDATATSSLSFNGDEIPASQVQRTMLAAMSGFFAEITTTEAFLK